MVRDESGRSGWGDLHKASSVGIISSTESPDNRDTFRTASEPITVQNNWYMGMGGGSGRGWVGGDQEGVGVEGGSGRGGSGRGFVRGGSERGIGKG